MTNAKAIADHWGKGDVYGLIVSALNKMSKPLEGLTVEELAPVDHFHARGFPATVELADRVAEEAQCRAQHRRGSHPPDTADLPQTTMITLEASRLTCCCPLFLLAAEPC